MKKILITGANSYIGTSFENHVTDNYPDDYVIDTIDMMDEKWKEKSFVGYDSVFHVAGIAHSDGGKISKEREEKYYAVNTNLAVESAKKAKKEGVKQFVFMSSIIVYGESAPIGQKRVINRETQVSPTNCYGDSKVQAEKGLVQLEDDNFKVVILRPPMIYGKGSKGNYSLLSKIASKSPIFPYVENQRSMLYIGNFCEFVRLMIQNGERGTFWPQNKEYSNTSELVKLIADSKGKRIILLRGFVRIFKLLGKKVNFINKAFGNLYYEQEMSEYKDEYQTYNLRQSIEMTEL